MKKLLPVILLILWLNPLIAQYQNVNNSFVSGENVTYQVYYNLGFLWLSAGMASFNVADTNYNHKTCYRINSYGTSYPNYDWLYKVRDQFTTIVDPKTILPYYYYQHSHEGSYEVTNKFLFNYSDSVVYSFTKNSNKPFTRDTIKLKNNVYDVLSAIYSCRTINFNNKKTGQKIPISLIINGEVFELYIRYLGKEEIVTRDNRIFNCNKFSVYLVEGTIFKGGEDMMVWVTDDKNQVPVCIESQILVGSVKAFVDKISGTKWPANYQKFKTD